MTQNHYSKEIFVKDYFDIHNHYSKQYGTYTLILMQVGSFHECFLALYFCLDPQIVDFEDSNFDWVTVTD